VLLRPHQEALCCTISVCLLLFLNRKTEKPAFLVQAARIDTARRFLQREVHHAPRAAPARHRHRTECDAPNGPGFARRHTAAARRRTSVRTGYGPQVPAQAPPRHLTKAHTPRPVCIWSYNFRLGRNRPSQLKNRSGFTWICALHQIVAPPLPCGAVPTSHTRAVFERTRKRTRYRIRYCTGIVPVPYAEYGAPPSGFLALEHLSAVFRFLGFRRRSFHSRIKEKKPATYSCEVLSTRTGNFMCRCTVPAGLRGFSSMLRGFCSIPSPR
jgi:hypothetical protein